MHMYTQYVKRGKNETFIKISISVSLAANTFKKNGFVYFIQSTGSIFCFLSHLHTNWEMLIKNKISTSILIILSKFTIL